MFEVNPSPTSANAITSLAETNAFLAEQVMPKVYQQLQLFASDPTFIEQLKLPFGDTWDIQKAQTLATEWLTGDFSTLAPIKIVASADIKGSSGAFADTTNQIYLAEDILTGSNVNQAVSVVLEEIGHSIDPRLNSSDSLGDDGEIFANIVQGKGLSPEQIQTLKAEDDHATITIDGKILAVEFNDFYDFYSQNWGGEIFDWTTGQKESKGWYSFTRNDQNAVSTRNSISRNWGNGSPNDVGSDYFGVNLWTIANFEAGNTYNFSVTADDYYRLGVIPVNAYDSNQWVNISGQDWNWLNDAYNGKQYTFTPAATGEYWVYAGYNEEQDVASFNISWETTNSAPSSVSGNASNKGETKGIFIESSDGSPIKDVPTWIVVHGNANNSDTPTIKNLAESLKSNDPNTQVLLLDWGSAANYDNGSWNANLDKSTDWIQPVADTATTLINNLGLSTWNLNFVGHSLGTYVSWEIANRMGGINRLVALDPAADFPGWYDTNNINFSQPSDWSWAFYGSALGSPTRANTADESFEFKFPFGTNDFDKHGEVVNAFTDTIKQNKSGNAGYLTSAINLNKMGTPDERPWYIGEGFEAILSVDKDSNSEWVINGGDSLIADSNGYTGFGGYTKFAT